MSFLRNRKSALFVLLLFFISLNLLAAEKRPFTIDDYAQWRSITSTSISPDGFWATYAYQKTKADDEFYVRSLESEKEYKVMGASNPRFSEDSRWAAYMVNLPWKEAEKLRKEKKPVPRKVELLDLSSGEKTTFENATSFIFAKDSGYLAVKKSASDPKAKYKGADLILYNLISGTVQNVGNVSEFLFNKPGKLLAYIVDASEKTGNGLYLIDLTSGTQMSLDTDAADYAQITWNEKGTALAALKGTKKKEFKENNNVLLAYTGIGKESQTGYSYDPATDPDFPKDMVLSELSSARSGFRRSSTPARGNLFWSEDLSMVFCGIKEQEKVPEKRKEEEDPPADVDVWHWRDDYLQSVQKVRASRDKNFTYRSVFNLKENKFIRLCDERMRTASVTRDGFWAIGQDENEYLSDWKEARADYYRINTRTGKRTLMFKGETQTLGLSPDSGHYLYWKEGHIWDYVVPTGRSLNLTAQALVSFVNTEYDHPGTKPSFGVAGWTKDGKSVILNHKYDLYLQPLDGSPASNLTQGRGTEKKIRLRYIQTDPEEKFIDMNKSLLLSAFAQWTKEAGFFRLGDGEMNELVLEQKYFGRLLKAKQSDRCLYTIETFKDFPDYHISGLDFRNPRRLTDANPHRSEFKWGYNTLIEYTNKDGKRLQGVLMIPEDYKEGEKLPML
ncbi:hypothetical protein ACFLT9_13470, partial [Acidobacteriota bacterium]